MEINDVVMVSGCRTAIGKFMGSLKNVQARDLAITAGKEAIKRAGISADSIDDIVMGEVFQGMQGSLPARQVGLACGLPHRSSACVVNQNCTSGMRALEVAANSLMLGKTEIALVVGVESMTNAPYLLPKARMGYRMNQGKIEDSMIHDGLYDNLIPGHMAISAENIAKKYGITREQCDKLAMESHQKATKAVQEGRFKKEIVPVELKSRKGTKLFDTDEHFIPNANMESMGKLRPAFIDDGVVTAANASGINDAAAAAILMTKKKAAELGLKPMLRLLNCSIEGVDPKYMGIGPAVVIPKALKLAGVKFEDVEYWELNEACASQFIGCKIMLKDEHDMDLDNVPVNNNGSGISLGHPVGCTALRLCISLYYELERLGKTVGGASTCVGGGPAMASIWTRDI